MGTTAVEKAIWRSEGEEKRREVRQMFSDIAPVYDRVNGVMSLSRHRVWRRQAVRALGVRPGESALDICCGTGDFLFPLGEAVGMKGRVVGLDYCAPMLRLAADKAHGAPLTLADACALPFTSNSFDVVTVGWGLRNLSDLNRGLSEVVRVLKPGGRFASLDMAIPLNPVIRWGSGVVCGSVLPALGRLYGNKDAYAYLPKSAERFASRQELKAAFEAAGLVDVRIRDFMLGNICLVWGRKP